MQILQFVDGAIENFEVENNLTKSLLNIIQTVMEKLNYQMTDS